MTHQPHRRPRHVTLALGLLAVLAALLLAACGSSSSGSSGSAATTSTTANGPGGFRNNTRLVACLRQQGVTLPQRARRPQGAGGTGTGTGTNGTPPPGGRRLGGGLFGGSGGRALSSAQRTKLQAAVRACGASVGAGSFGRGGFGGARRNSATYRAAVTKFVACVKQHGYALPAPNLSGSGPVFDASKVNQRDPRWIAASRACQSLLPRGGSGAGQGGGQPPAGGTTTTS